MNFKPCLLALGSSFFCLLAPSARAQFLWAERIAATTSAIEGGNEAALTLDAQDDIYVTGWFDGMDNFGGATLTNQSPGGQDIFVAEYNSSGALQWAERAGGSPGNFNFGQGIGVDSNKNVYVTGGFYGPADFGPTNLPGSGDGSEEFYLAKYNSAGAIQWVQQSLGGSEVYGTGLAVDGAGNSYAVGYDNDGDDVTFGATNLTFATPSGYSAFLVKYDTTGAVQWAQAMSGSDQVYTTKVAVDINGNVYVRGEFGSKETPGSTLTIGTSNLVVSAGSLKNMFLAKFDSSGNLVWIQHPSGGNVDEGGVALDENGNIYVTGAFFGTPLIFGGGISLASSSATNAFIAKYNSSGVIQWAHAATGNTKIGFFMDVATDAQGNAFAAGCVSSDATVASYTPAGALQWSYAASGPPASLVSSIVTKCAVDPAGDCYLAGLYQGKTTFGKTVLQPQETWNFFLADIPAPVTVTPGVFPVGAGASSVEVSGSSVTLTATPSATLKDVFLDWTVNGVVVNSKSPYTFTPAASETVVANFGFSITTSSSPAAGGKTTGAGAYPSGQNATVTATPNDCYDFTGWTKAGQTAVLSTDTSYTFPAVATEALVANFKLKEDQITTSSSPVSGGTTTGAKTYGCDTTVTVSAKAANGYKFNSWIANNVEVSMKNPYSFEASGAEALTAVFEDISVPTLTLTSPKASESVSSPFLTVTGTANNVLGVSSVVVTVAGVPVPVTTGNNWSNWTASVVLSPGANVIDVYALSEVDTPSKTETITVKYSNTGLAPFALAGLIAQVTQNGNPSFQVSFGTATYEQFSTDTNQGFAVGNYTYTQTGPNTATLVLVAFAPPNQVGQGSSGINLTFTSPTTANFIDNNGNTGAVSVSPGSTAPVASPAVGISHLVDTTAGDTLETTWGDGVFTTVGSEFTNIGTFTYTQCGPNAGYLVEVITNQDSGYETLFDVDLFTSLGSTSEGYYYSALFNSSGSSPLFFDFGTFVHTNLPSTTVYVAPETLAGMSASVKQTSPQAQPAFNLSFGEATLAQTSSSSNNASRVSNYIYTRTGRTTATLNTYDYLPPPNGNGNNGSPIYLTFTSPTSLTFEDPSGPSSGSISLTVLPPADYYAPAALPQDLTLDGVLNGKSGSVQLDNGNYTEGPTYGTYTYAQFSPTVGLITTTLTDPEDVGLIEYVQLTFNSPSGGSTLGDLSDTKNNGSIKIGTFSFAK